MRRQHLFTMFCLCLVNLSLAQQSYIDSLIRDVNQSNNDTSKLVRLRTIARLYSEISPDSSYHYCEKALELARRMHFKLDEGGTLRDMSYSFLNKGNSPRALQTAFEAITIFESPQSERNVLVGKFEGDDEMMYRKATPHLQRLSELAFMYQILGVLYANSNNYEKAWRYHLMGRKYADESGNLAIQSILNLTINRVYLNLKKNDSALISINVAYDKAMQSGFKRYLGSILLNKGRTYAAMGNTTLANEYYQKSLVASEEQGYFRGVVAANILLAEYYGKIGKHDSAFYHIKSALAAAKNLEAPELLLRTYTALSNYYLQTNNNDSAVRYQGLVIKLNESLSNSKQAQQFQAIDFDAEQRQQQIQATEKEYRNRLQKNLLLAGLGAILIVAIILFRNNKQKQQSNNALQKALTDLRATQAQLVMSEKMASLGEHTAGIAYEIQNPLNFVNNFSEVNTELIDDLEQEASKGNLDEIKAIVKDIKDNEQKINHHGKRADSIVKGMLQHSRISSGQKEPTDINALADEYLRLAYHGLRAKDKSFNATMNTDFDNHIDNINVNRQDIGRVILNLINNAFYAVNEKQKQNLRGYEPTVVVRTRKTEKKIEIMIKDNGIGIPQKIMDKIFQPFFTTKPTGEGTGLGLSLAYDIITKGHGGELKVGTKVGEGSEFIIQLPG